MEKKNLSVSRPVKLMTAVTAVVVVIAILAVMVLNYLPSSVLEFDMTANDLYSVSPVTKNLLAGVEDPLEIRVFCDSSSVDEHFTKYMDKYVALSDKLSMVSYDTVKEPTATTEYGADSNTVQVCNTNTGMTSSFQISGFDGQDAVALLYDYTSYYMYGRLTLSSFDCEGRLASAINAVTGGKQYNIYFTTGHDEVVMASTITSLLNKANYVQTQIDLLSAGSVPDDCDLLVINCPGSDLADDELTMLKSWLADGGKLFVVCDNNTLPNIKALLMVYGIQMEEGYLADVENYYPAYTEKFGYYCFQPVYNEDSSICKNISSKGMVIGAVPLTLVTAERRGSEAEYFMSSSTHGVNVTGSDTENPDYQTYHVGVVAVEPIDDETESRLTVISSGYFDSESLLSSFTSLSNADIIMNAINANFDGEASAISIGAKSMSVSYNTFTNTTLYNVFFLGIVPIAFLAVGIVCCVRRRKQ